MPWIWLILLLSNLGLLIVLLRAIRGSDNQLQQMNQKLDLLVKCTTSRQTQVAHRTTTSGTPHVDAKARTTRRDSSDLPVASRMSRIATHRGEATTPEGGPDD